MLATQQEGGGSKKKKSVRLDDGFANYDYMFKIVVVGERTVGKSSILQRFVDNKFCDSMQSTIGVVSSLISKVNKFRILKLYCLNQRLVYLNYNFGTQNLIRFLHCIIEELKRLLSYVITNILNDYNRFMIFPMPIHLMQ